MLVMRGLLASLLRKHGTCKGFDGVCDLLQLGAMDTETASYPHPPTACGGGRACPQHAESSNRDDRERIRGP